MSDMTPERLADIRERAALRVVAVLHAEQDVEDLLAHVDHLTAELATAHVAWDEWKASSLAGHAHASDMAAEVVRLREGIKAIHLEAWEPWLEQDAQHLDTVRIDCARLLNPPTEGES